MVVPLLITIAFFPCYFILRRPYFALPLHVDSGYYVSGATIQSGRVAYSRGWNAVYAGCGKVLPELFYSRVYLRWKGREFAERSRFVFSIVNYLTAITVGLTLYTATGEVQLYGFGLIAFAWLSSEPQYGGYYESGEQFELLAQALGLLLATLGLNSQSPWWIGAGAALWMGSALFIKLSSLLWCLPTFGALLGIAPRAWPAVLAGTVAVSVFFLIWVSANGVGLRAWLNGLLGHEQAVGGTTQVAAVLLRIRAKAYRAISAGVRRPVIPILSIAGMVWAGASQGLFWSCLAGALLTYFAQAAMIRYYLLPLLLPVSLFAAIGCGQLAESGWGGRGALLALAFGGVVQHLREVRSRSAEQLHADLWRGDDAEEMAQRSLDLHRHQEALRVAIGGPSLLVYGPLTQAYLLLHAAYPLSLLAPNRWLDDMDRGWQRKLNRELVKCPPGFILDSDHCFDSKTAAEGLGLEYRLCRTFSPTLRLFEYVGRLEVTVQPEVRTFAPQPVSSDPFEDRTLGDQLHSLQRQGARRLGIYGTGREFLRHLHRIRSSALEIVAVFDDDPRRAGEIIEGRTVQSLQSADATELDALLVCSRTYGEFMMRRARPLAARGIRIIALGSGATDCQDASADLNGQQR